MFILDQIDQLRKQNGITIADLCKIINISVQTYHNWKLNKGGPTYAQIETILKHFNIKLVWVIRSSF